MPNATQLLRQDHKKVKALFAKFEQGKAANAKRRFAMQSINELEVHARVEEEIFYPAVKQAIEASELVDEAKKNTSRQRRSSDSSKKQANKTTEKAATSKLNSPSSCKQYSTTSRKRKERCFRRPRIASWIFRP